MENSIDMSNNQLIGIEDDMPEDLKKALTNYNEFCQKYPESLEPETEEEEEEDPEDFVIDNYDDSNTDEESMVSNNLVDDHVIIEDDSDNEILEDLF